jgi:hypothetical protein
MTEPGAEPTGEQEEFPMEAGEYLAGGIEIHARCVEQGGKPGVDFLCEPIAYDRDLPEAIAEYNQVLEEIVRETVTNFTDPRCLGRFYREIKKDGLRDRCWYRVTVTATVDEDDKIKARVTDVIDPALVRADPHIRFRMRQLRAMVVRGLGE